MDQDLNQQIQNIAKGMEAFHQGLEIKAKEAQALGIDQEAAEKLFKGADAMKDSGNIYLSWARHFVKLSEGDAAESHDDEDDSADFQF